MHKFDMFHGVKFVFQAASCRILIAMYVLYGP